MFADPPSQVIIKGNMDGEVGDKIELTCEASASNPAAEISWMLDGKPVLAHSYTTEALSVGNG